MAELNCSDFEIQRLGECRIPSPMATTQFVSADERVPLSRDPRGNSGIPEFRSTAALLRNGGASAADILRSLEAQVRNSNLWWIVPRP